MANALIEATNNYDPSLSSGMAFSNSEVALEEGETTPSIAVGALGYEPRSLALSMESLPYESDLFGNESTDSEAVNREIDLDDLLILITLDPINLGDILE